MNIRPTRRAALAAVTLALCLAPASGFAQPSPPPAPMTLIIYGAGSAWKPGRPPAEQGLAPHIAYVARHFKAGQVIAYGTQVDAVRGYYLLAGGDPELASRFIAADPAVKARILKPEPSHRLSLVINGFVPKQEGAAYALLRMQPGAAWVRGKSLSQQNLGEHLAYMTAKAREGTVLAAALDGSDREGWYVVRGDKSAIDALLAGDPGVTSGVLKPSVIGWDLLDMQPTR